jgi:hypothetical protein
VKVLQMHGPQRTAFENYLTFGTGSTDPNEMLWTIDWRDYDRPYCSLYVVTPDNDWPCKVGISVSPRKRVMGLQTSVWRPLKVAACFWCPTIQDARRLEMRVHQMLTDDKKWMHGEWFDMKPGPTCEMINFAACIAGIECNSTIDEPEIRAAVSDKLMRANMGNARHEKRYEMRKMAGRI